MHPRKEKKEKKFDFSGRSEILDCTEYHQHLISKIVNLKSACPEVKRIGVNLKSYIFLNVTLNANAI